MPRLFGFNVVGVLAAAVAFFMVGWIVYGALFTDLWMSLHNVTQEQTEAAGMSWLAPAFLITLMQVVGLAFVLRWRGVEGISGAVITASILWVFFAVPAMSYDPVYLPNEGVMSLVLDGLHLYVGWIIAAVVLTVLK